MASRERYTGGGVGNVDLDSLPAAFSEWEHEPDPPIWTPRIIAAIGTGTPPRFVAATARRIASGATDHLWHTGEAATSTAVRMHTYTGPVHEPRPDGTTTWVTTADDLDHAANQMWDALSPDRRVLVAARDLTSGEFVCRHRT